MDFTNTTTTFLAHDPANGQQPQGMQTQEVTSVEEGIGATYLPEVDDAGVPAVAIEPDVRRVEVAVGYARLDCLGYLDRVMC